MNMQMQAEPISVIITNYNYAHRLAAAIDSALAIDWPAKEVIVVDDGSTDGSPALIRAYGDRIKCVLKAQNGGQNSAANAGYAISGGGVVFFLDSDDTLDPHVAQKVIPLFAAETAKVQFPLVTVRPDGTSVGLYPRFPLNYAPASVRKSMASTGFYVSSPTSGNAWPRWFLDLALPLPSHWTEKVPAEFFDGYLSTLAARLGDVVTIAEPLGTYYINPDNMWSRCFSPRLIADACEELIARTKYLNARLRALDLGPVERQAYTQRMQQLVYCKYFPDAFPLEQKGASLLRASLLSAATDPGLSMRVRLLVMAWMVAVTALPRRLALPVVKMRFVQGYRPGLARWLLTSRARS
jgi:glycosyltransferase involved in cell wall biosynthesis